MRAIIISIALVALTVACGDSEQTVLKKADKIHAAVLTVDTHCDTPMRFTRPGFDIGKKNEDGCVDFPRMIEGGLNAEFFAVYLGQGPRTDEGLERAYQRAKETFTLVHENVARYPEMAEIALTPDDAYRLKKEGKIAAFIGMENGYPIGKDITRIEEFYNLGMRYITLSHSSNNDICDSSTDRNGSEHDGLSAFGEEVVAEMNRLGIMVDVSHISDASFYDVIRLSKAPVIASHSSCRAICENPRNLDDDMLLALKENGGVIQICILGNYLIGPNPELEARNAQIRAKYEGLGELTPEQRSQMRDELNAARRELQKVANVSDAVDHIDHVVQVIGIDHVGVGTDFDGGGGVEGCRTVADMKNITIELVRRGYSKKEIEKIWGGNFMRVFREVERIASTI
ncbi:MAG: dipeptidase [Bacteroidales bacterium]|jgi:membrane dipeptidase|nr:dipeptidase [Bacteroidales bacterium]